MRGLIFCLGWAFFWWAALAAAQEQPASPSAELSKAVETAQAALDELKKQGQAKTNLGFAAMRTLANAQLDSDNFAAARATAQQAAELHEELFGKDDGGTFDARQLVADVDRLEKLSIDQRVRVRAAFGDNTRSTQLRLAGKAAEALPLARSAHKTTSELLGAPHPRTMQALNELALVHLALGDYQASLAASQQVLQGREATLPERHPDLALSVSNLAVTQEWLKDHATAKAGHLRAAALFEKLYGRNSETVASALNAAGRCGYFQQDYREALRLQTEALAIYEKILPAESEQLSWQYGNVASDHYALEDYPRAIEFRRRELAILEKLDPQSAQTAGCLNRLGAAFYSDNKYSEALAIQQRSLAIYEQQSPVNATDIAVTCANIASDYYALRDYAKAIEFRRRQLASLESLAPESLDVARCLDELGGTHYTALQYEEGLKLKQRALALFEKLDPTNQAKVAILLKDIGHNLTGLRRFDEAHDHLRRALKIHEQGPETLSMAICLNAIGWAYYEAGRYRDSLEMYQRGLSIREKLLGPEHADVAANLADLADNQIELGDYPQSLALRERAYAIREQALGPEHLSTIRSLSELGASHDRMGNFTKAREFYEKTLALREKQLGPDDRLVGYSLNHLCLLYSRMGLAAESEKAGLRAIAIAEKTAGKDSLDIAFCLNNLGLLYSSRSDYAPARQHLARALAIRERKLGPTHPQTGISLNNLALVYMDLRDYAQAIPLFLRALDISRKFNGPEHPDTALNMANLGWAAARLGQLETARQWYIASLVVRRKALGNEHYDTAATLASLANVLRRQDKLAEALPPCLEAFAIRQKVLPPEHPDLADSHGELALLYERLGDPRAEEHYLKALAIREKAYGPDSPAVATTLTNLGSWYQVRKEFAAAKPLHQRALAIRRKHLELVAELQAERQQLAMAGAFRWHLDWYVDLVAESGAEADDLYAQVLVWKGAVLARQRAARLGDEGADPQVAKTLQALRDTSGQLAALVLDVPSEDGRAAWRERIAQLTNDRQQLEEELARLSAAFRSLQTQEQVSVRQIQAALPADAVLVDLLEYSHQTSVEKNDYETRLAAFIVKPAGGVKLVPLGAGTPIYAAVDAWRTNYGSGRDKAESHRNLRRMLWEPLAGPIGEAQMLLISPDGGLGRFPWAALPVDDAGQYLIERLGVAVVPVPRLIPALFAARVAEASEPSLCLVGDVDFGAEAGAAGDQVAARIAAGGRGGILRKWPALPATRAEILAVRDSYEAKHPGSPVEVLRKAGATEEQLRRFAVRSRYLHLATHGFFAPDELKSVLSAPIDVAGQRHAGASPPAAPADLPQMAGIGAALEVNAGKLMATRVLPDGAAGLDGRLKVGDQLLAVAEAEGEFASLVGLSLSDAIARIRGKVETRVRVKVAPADGGQEYVLELTRRALPLAEEGALSIETLHPGLLSGIVLAGANQPPDPTKDDGVLTALEVADLDLRQLELATLSACETGLGATANGEGLLGLQRAFQVAGAKSVVASLWKVDDDAARDLMERFYENLWTKNMGKLQALREAQLWMLKERGPRGLTRIETGDTPQNRLPPYYWAPFVLSGDWR
ncbi:MAG: tetratricopeptide repeat protein [Pirellulaceae bacterium]|nr:tetratricopeptide repeat protein [Pirellulaceae bacterium]